MKIEIRIPTEQYGYANVELEVGNGATPAEVRALYNEYVAAFKNQGGLTEKEFNAFVDAQLLNQPNHIEMYEKASDQQKTTIQVLKRALKRLESRNKDLKASE